MGAEQCAEALPEDDGRSKDADYNQKHGKINNSHQYGTEQKTETDKQCVFEHGANRIIESGKKREYIH